MKTLALEEIVEARHGHADQFGIATIAGTPYDPSGEGGPATSAAINLTGIAFRDGKLYLCDGARIRRIAEDGIITTVVGLLDPVIHQPIPGFSGDGGPALKATLRGAFALEFDSAGNLFIADGGNSCVRKVTARVVGGAPQPIDGTEIITTVAGMGAVVGNSGDNGPATAAKLSSPRDLAIDPGTGVLYIVDQNNDNIRKVDASGVITTIGGTGSPGFMDGAAAVSMFNLPTGVTVDTATGDVYVADVLNSRVRKISKGMVSTIAGSGASSTSGNPTDVHPVRVKFVNGVIYMLDSGLGTLRLIDLSTSAITTLVGSGLPGYSGAFPPVGDGGPASAALMGSGPGGVQDVAFDSSGNVFIPDASSRRVRFVALGSTPASIFGQTVAAGTIATVAGPPGIVTFSGDGGPAANALLFPGPGMALSPDGALYFSDSGNNRVRQISPANGSARIITTTAGSGAAGFQGVPGSALAARLQPNGLAFNGSDLYLTNNGNRVLEVAYGSINLIANTTGVTTPAALNGDTAFQAHIGAASLVFDHAGNLYAADTLNNRIWKIDTNGIVTKIAGGGSVVIDGTTVTSATANLMRLFGPGGLVLDSAGNLYTVDGSRHRILRITAHAPHQPLDGTETVTVFAGLGTPGFSGDGGPATAAQLNGPGGLAFDTDGQLYFSESGNFRIRRIDTQGIITTVAGTGTASFSGDGGPALLADLRGGPLAFDAFGNLFLLDIVNNVVRVLDRRAPSVVFGAPVPAANPNGWHNTSVSIPFTASDEGAGVASTSPMSPLQLSAEGIAESGVVTATDRAGNQAKYTSHPVKIDKHGPLIAGMPNAGHLLWPPDGRMVHVAKVTAFDHLSGLAPGSFLVNATSSEPDGSHQISIMADGSGGFDVWLAAQRLATGHGRTYTLTATARDRADNFSSAQTTCVVPLHH